MLRPIARPLACLDTHLLACAASRTGHSTNIQVAVPWIARRTQASLASDDNEEKQGQLLAADEVGDGERERYPLSLQALYLKPLKREAEFGIPSCDLQLRSYSMQPLEFFADFAMRAAYYLGLPAYGPVPLPRITERWTVPKSHFVFKKSQQNFERRTLRRLIQIRDGHPETVQLWLAYLRKHQYCGLGMKANYWDFSKTGVGKSMELPESQLKELDPAWSHLGQTKDIGTAEKVDELLSSQRLKEAIGFRESLASNP